MARHAEIEERLHLAVHQSRPAIAAFLTGPKPKEITVETVRIDYLIRTPKVEKVESTANKLLGIEGKGLRVFEV